MNYLTQQDMPGCGIDVLIHRVTTGHHVAVLELHALRTLCAQLARHNDLAALGT